MELLIQFLKINKENLELQTQIFLVLSNALEINGNRLSIKML